jgi:hypothetical protein
MNETIKPRLDLVRINRNNPNEPIELVFAAPDEHGVERTVIAQVYGYELFDNTLEGQQWKTQTNQRQQELQRQLQQQTNVRSMARSA